MAGYNRPGADLSNDGVFTNATSYNSQIVKQREEYKARQENQNRTHGIASDTSLLFTGFEADKIIEAAAKQFLVKEVTAGDNPDFAISDFKPDKFKSFRDIKIQALNSSGSDAPDGALIGVGPTLATQDIDDATRGILTNNFVGTNNRRNRGFGWRSDYHGNRTIGSYLSDKYKFNNADQSEDPVTQGENIDVPIYINYDQPQPPQP